MLRNFALLLSFALSVSEGKSDPLPSSTTVSIDPSTTMVFFGTRHGNRNPEKFVNVPNRNWGQEGDLELTSIGKRQAYGLGKAMRAFVGDKVNSNFVPSDAKFYSSSANRCQMTLQTALAGLYDPVAWADWNTKSFDHWSPVPYTIDDTLLRMYSVKGCVNSDKAWDPISKDTLPELAELAHKNRALLEYIRKNEPGREAKISEVADVADNILQMDFYNASYPDWLANPSLPGYTRQSLRDAILSFTESHTIMCANYAPCRDLMGGTWASNILEWLDKASKGKPAPRIIGYASHTEVTLSLMKLIGIEKKELTTSAGFVIEYKTSSAGPAVRLLNHDPNPIDAHVIYRSKLVPMLNAAVNSEGWLPLQTFRQYVSENTISDWKSSCGINTCEDFSSGGKATTTSLLLLFFTALFASL